MKGNPEQVGRMDTATISTNPRERNTHDNAHNRRRMGKNGHQTANQT